MTDSDHLEFLQSRIELLEFELKDAQERNDYAFQMYVDANEAKIDAMNEVQVLRSRIHLALLCTPSVRDGEIIYDCGNPWELLKGSLDNG